MALTIIEQIKILKGEVSPTEVTLARLVEQPAITEVTTLLPTIKDFDATVLTDASRYRAKVREQMENIIGRPDGDSEVLSKALIAIYSVGGDYSTVESATDAQWEGFIVANIMEAIETVAGVFAHEKTEYDGI